MLAMDMDKIFDPASTTTANQEEDIKTVQAASNETTSSRPGAAPRPRKKTRTRKSRSMTITEKGAEDTDSKSSITLTNTVMLSRSDFSSGSGKAKHDRQHSTRKKENMGDKAVSKETGNTIKEDHHVAETNEPIPCTTNLLPRSITRVVMQA